MEEFKKLFEAYRDATNNWIYSGSDKDYEAMEKAERKIFEWVEVLLQTYYDELGKDPI